MAIPQLGRRQRQYLLVLHVLLSVGWFGAGWANLVICTAALLALADVAPLTAFVLVEQIDYWAVIPCAFGALVTGTILSLSTKWGLVSHWWVLVKFVLTIVVIVSATFGIGFWVEDNVTRLRDGLPVAHEVPLAVAGASNLAAFVFMTWLSVLKPFGRTPWGVKKAGRRAARR